MDLRNELTHWPSKEKVQEITGWIGDDPDRFTQLIQLVLRPEEKASKYAAWLMGHSMEAHPRLICPHLPALVANLDQPKLNDSIVRSTVKALAVIEEVPEPLQGRVLQHCFDLLMNPRTAVAIQVHSMQVIFNISKDEPDLLRELRMVIEDGMEVGSAGYRSRGRRLLGEIGRVLKD